MAQTEHLPIYKASYDLCLYLEQVVRGFSRYHKYTLGADLRDGARRVLKLLVRANARRDKVPILLEVREEVEQLKVVLRLSQDVKAFANFGAFEHAIEQVVAIAVSSSAGWGASSSSAARSARLPSVCSVCARRTSRAPATHLPSAFRGGYARAVMRSCIYASKDCSVFQTARSSPRHSPSNAA